MLDYISATVAAIWTALTLFLASTVEPMPGVWIAATSGAILSGFTGADKPLGRLLSHVFLAGCFGIALSQIIPEIISIKGTHARVGLSFFCALFSEKIIAAIHNGSMSEAIQAWRRGK
jgi:hypothetical protein